MKTPRISYIIPFLLFILGCGSVSASNVQDLTYKESRFQETIKIGMTKEQVKKNGDNLIRLSMSNEKIMMRHGFIVPIGNLKIIYTLKMVF